MRIENIGKWGKDYFYKNVDYKTQVFNRNSDYRINNSIAYSVAKINEIQTQFKNLPWNKIYLIVLVTNYPKRNSFLLCTTLNVFMNNAIPIKYDKINCDSQLSLNMSFFKEIENMEDRRRLN